MKECVKYIRNLALLLFYVLPLSVFADNTVTVSSVSGRPGDEVTVTVSLANTDKIVAGEFDFTLGDNLTYIKGSAHITDSDAVGYGVSSSAKDNALKIIVYNLNNGTLATGQRQLFSFRLKLGRIPDAYQLSPHAIISNFEGKALPVTVSGGSVTVLAPWLNVGEDTIDFGHVAIREPHIKKITLKNDGTEALHIKSINSSNSELVCELSAFTILPGEGHNVNVTLQPQESGTKDYSLDVISDAWNGSQHINVIADAYSVNELKVGSVSGKTGDEVTVNLDMNNMEDIVALQTTFTLSEGIEYVEGSLSLSTRATSMLCSESYIDNRLTLFIYSLQGGQITGNTGTVCSFKLRLKAKSGVYDLLPEEVILGNANMENMLSALYKGNVSVQSASIQSASSIDIGSIDCTKTADVTYSIKNVGMTDLVINNVVFSDEGFSLKETCPIIIASGATEDITIKCKPKETDFSTLMQLYTNDPETAVKDVKLYGKTFEPNTLVLDANDNGKTVSLNISMDNYSTVVAAQMDIHLPTGMHTDEIQTSDRLSGHNCRLVDLGEGDYRVIIYSMDELPIRGNSGALFSVVLNKVNLLEAKIIVDNILLSAANGRNCSSVTQLNCMITESHIIGDANKDGIVDRNDILAILKYMAGNRLSDFDAVAADANKDEIIDIADCTKILEILK